MAIGWMTVLRLVPWGDVVRNAPVIADGARKLWDTVGRGPVQPPATGSLVPRRAVPADSALQDRLAQAEESIVSLQAQMRDSSELIKALAEQNAELVRRAEVHRVRVLWLAGVVAVLGAIGALNLLVTLS